MKKIITSYNGPDLDGVACMFAYEEYLKNKGENAHYYINGKPKEEVKIVCDILNIHLNSLKNWEKPSEAVLVDLNNVKILKFIKPEEVVEIIDHHVKTESCNLCVNAKVQIELLGAAATLVAERFKNENIKISRESAILLYYAIISNCINLKAKTTKRKDIEMTDWLKNNCAEISEEKIEEIFRKKSILKDENLREDMEARIVLNFKGKRLIAAQLEITDVEDFLKEKEEKIRNILKQIKKEEKLNQIFIDCIDILKGTSIILTVDTETENFLGEMFNFKFKAGKSKQKELVTRKDITNNLRLKNEK